MPPKAVTSQHKGRVKGTLKAISKEKGKAIKMKKAEQLEINARVAKEVANFMNETSFNGTQFISRLRSCSAEVLASDSYYILRSYNTIIAIIDADGVCYDFLRDVYGYTATSAQHISKFAHDYGTGKILSWKAV